MLPLLLALGLVSPTHEPLSVVGGEPAPEVAFEAIINFENSFSRTSCTGTLVRPDLVLTAGHCIRAGTTVPSLRVFRPLSLGGGAVGVASFGAHPDMCLDCSTDEFDFGYLRLAEPLDVPPLEIITDQEAWDVLVPDRGTVTVVGWGDVPERGALGVSGGASRYQSGASPRPASSSSQGRGQGQLRRRLWRSRAGPRRRRRVENRRHHLSRTRALRPGGGYYGVPYHAMAWLSEEVSDPTLCGADCGSCDCLDTRAPAEEGCCSTGQPVGIPWLLFVLLWLRSRRPARNEHQARRPSAPHT